MACRHCVQVEDGALCAVCFAKFFGSWSADDLRRALRMKQAQFAKWVVRWAWVDVEPN